MCFGAPEHHMVWPVSNLTLDLLLSVTVRADVTAWCTSFAVLQWTDKQSRRDTRQGDPQQHSHSQSSCLLHCRSSRHCPYWWRNPWQRRLDTCHSSAWYREEDKGGKWASQPLVWCVNTTKKKTLKGGRENVRTGEKKREKEFVWLSRICQTQRFNFKPWSIR